MKTFYVYILTSQNNRVLYTGVTNSIIRRCYEHKMKLVDGFTKKYNVNKLVYYKEFATAMEAIEAEKRIKGWIRKKKIQLITGHNPGWQDLYLNII